MVDDSGFIIEDDNNPEDKYGRFFRDYSIDIQLIEDFAFAGEGGSIDLTNYYTKSQADALLAPKENVVDLTGTYYTKVQTDSFLSNKADANALNNYLPLTQKGIAAGLATLDNNTLIPPSQIPTLPASKVGLTNVDNTSDVDKPISDATQEALDLKMNSDAILTADQIDSLPASKVGLANVDNTTDLNKPISNLTQTALNLKANDSAVIHNSGTETVTGVKTFSNIPIVPSNSFPESSVINLTADLAAKLVIANNLSDLGSASTARTNLGLSSAAVASLPLAISNGGTGSSGILPSGDTSGATDVVAINNAIAAANTAGGGTVSLQAGTYYVNSPIILKSTVVLRGSNLEATIIKLANSSNVDVIQGLNFSSLTLTGASTWQTSGIWDCALVDLVIDGNRANQTTAGFGIRLYGYNWSLTNLDVRNCFIDGIWTEWGPLSSDAPNNTDGSECTVNNVKIHHNGRHGWSFLGPSDCRLTNVLAFKNNQTAANSSIGFWALQDRVSNILTTASSMNATASTGFTGTFNVNNSTELYANSGTLSIVTSSGNATMTYTGKTSTAFTGCTVTAAAGNFQTNNTLTTTTSKFTTNGLQMLNCHTWSNDHTWACVIDGQTSMANCHWEGARYGQLLVRNSLNLSSGFIYDFSPIATSCGIQLGDDGTTAGLPISVTVAANSCNIITRISSLLNDTVLRASLRWVSASQSNIQLQNVTKTTGTYSTTVASASNNVDVSTWVGAGTLTVASTNQIPDGPGTITVVTSKGTITCTYTNTNGTIGASRSAGTQFTGLTAIGAASSSNLTTGNAVVLQNIGTVAIAGTVDTGSRIAVQSAGSSTAISTNASMTQEYGSRTLDIGSNANAFRLRNNGTDQLNINTVNKQLQLPNAQQILLYNDNYITKQLTIDGNLGTITGPNRGAKPVVFPGAHWLPGDHGLITWTGDPEYATANTAVATAGTVYHCKVHCSTSFTATNVIIYVVSAGTVLTAGQCFAGLYNSAGSLIASTADISSGATSFATSGSYTFPLAGGPYTNLVAGDYTVAFFFNGTAGPSLARFGNVAAGLINVALSAGNYRHFTDSTNTGRTTTLPATIGTQVSNGVAWFAAIS